LLRALESNQPAGPNAPRIRAKRVIFLFQWGGPSHVDMFDMKPNAPDQYRSPLTPIRSSCPDIQVCEELPETAKRMHKVTLIRTLTHTMKNHNSAGYYALSGHAPPTDDQRLRDSLDLFPAFGSIVDKLAPNKNGMPTFVAYPHVISDGSITPGQHASFLGKAHDPLLFTEDPNAPDFKLPELTLPDNLTLDRLHRRREMQRIVDRQARLLDYSADARGFDEYYDRAIGHSIDGDSRQIAAGLMLVNGDGSSWEIALQAAKVNREGANPIHSVSLVPQDITSVDLHHRRALFGGDLRVGIGYEERDANGGGVHEEDIRGYLQWSGRF